ncbi:MAG: hypothetical protein GY779_15820, partial [Gammaproteobacteria bacterium]|nr:hypothetical protein [Gammaproteobacteria bacterium]
MKNSLPILVMLSMLALSQGVMATDFTINTDVTTTNGGHILVGNDSLTVTENGSITTAGDDNHGIDVGADSTVTNDGTITTSGDDAHGIMISGDGDNTNIINNGTITAVDAKGIYARTSGESTDYLVITNNGSIDSSSDDGMEIYGNNAIITNNGDITSRDSKGIALGGSSLYGTIINNGTITIVEEGKGIYAYGNGGFYTVINNGTILSQHRGIVVKIQSHVTNNGSIMISGVAGSGYEYNSAVRLRYGGELDNHGTIIASGVAEIMGVHLNTDATLGSPDFVINNTGSIVISDTAGGAAILAADGANMDDSVLINNRGLISARGATNHAINWDDNDVDFTLNLLPGSRIIGAIDLGDGGHDDDIVNIYGGSPSARLTILNAEQINLYGAGIVNGTTVTAVDATAPTAQVLASASLSNSVHGTINQRMAYKPQLQPLQVASLASAPGMLYQEHKPVAWVQAFGGQRDYEANGSVMAYDHAHYGFNVGYEWDAEERRVGVMAGFARSDI